MADASVAQVPRAPALRGHPPRTAARPPKFFGWWIASGAVLAQFIATGQTQVTNVLLGAMTQELGWTRSEFTLASTIGTMLAGGLGFGIGAQVDRRSARPLLIAGTILSSVALILTAYVQELWQFWALRGVALVLGNVMIGNLVVSATISKWFVDRRRWAITLAALGLSGWSLLGTQLAGFVADGYGWRAAWMAMGFATWILLPVAMLMSRPPEGHGLLSDSRREEDDDGPRGRASMARAQAELHSSLTRGEAARTPALWLIALAFGLALTGMTALFSQLIQFFVDIGFAPAEARNLYSILGAAALAAHVLWSAAIPRVPAKALVVASFTMAGAATLGLLYTASSAPLVLVAGFSAMWGLATGGMLPLSEFVWESYFGRRHIEAVRSLALPFTVLMASAGPLFASQVFDRTGSYNLAMVVFAAMWFVGAVLVLVARRPQPRSIETVPLAHRLQPSEAPSATLMASHASMGAALSATPAADLRPPADVVRRALFPSAPPRGSDYLRPGPGVGPGTTARESTLLEFPTRRANEAPDAAAGPGTDELHAPPRRPERSYMGGGEARPRSVGNPEAAPPIEDPTVAPIPSPPAALDERAELRTPPHAPVPHAPTLEVASTDVAPAAAPSEEPDGPTTEPPLAPPPSSPGPTAMTAPARMTAATQKPPPPSWVPRSTSEAVLAGAVTSLVATAALWFLTRPGGSPKS